MPTFTNGIGDDFLEAEKKLQQDTSPGLLTRAAYHLLEAPATVKHGLTNTLATLTGSEHVPDERVSALPPARGAGEFLTDLTLGGMLPMGIEVAMTGALGRAAGLGRLAQTRPLLATVANDALAFGMLGAQQDAVTGLEQTAEGAAFGALRFLPKMYRAIPAAALGWMSQAFWDRNGEVPIYGDSDISQGDAAGALGAAVATLAGGKLPWRAPLPAATKSSPSATRGIIPNHFDQDVGSIPYSDAAIGRHDVFSNVRRGAGGLPSVNPWINKEIEAYRAHGTDPAVVGNPSLFRNIDQSTGYLAADAADTFIEQMLPKKEFIPPQPMVEPVLTGKSALRSAQVMDVNVETPMLAKQKAKVSKLPEHLRTEGGEIDRTLLMMAGKNIAGALGGAAGSDYMGVDPWTGAAIGVGVANMGSLIRRGIGAAQDVFAPIGKQNNAGSIRDPYSIRPAIKVGDKIIQGAKGETHKDILNRHMAANPDDVDALLNFDTKANPNFFVDAEGNAISRDMLKQELGVSHSQDLQQLQKVEPEKISHVFIKGKSGKLYEGKPGQLHFQVSAEIPSNDWSRELEMGFVTNKGRLVNRQDAATIAKANNQMKEGVSPSIWRLEADHLSKHALKPLSNEGAYIFPEMRAAMARASLGALTFGGVGGALGGEEGAVAGAMLGATALGMGPALIRSTMNAISHSRTIPAQGAASRPRGWANLAKNWGQDVIEEASGRALATSASPSDRFLRFMDKAFEITVPTVIKETLMKARGLASHLMDQMDSALTKVSMRFKPDDTLKKLAAEHLDGTLDSAAFLQRVQQSFPSDVQAQRFAEFVMAGRSAVNGLQVMVRDGIADPHMRKVINDSIGKYLTRSYKIFTSKDWEPSLQAIDNLVSEIHSKKVWGGASPADIRTALEQYVREVKQMKGLYGKPFGGPYGEKINQNVLKERKQLSDAWREFLGEITDPTERLYQTVFRLRPMAEAARYFDQLSTIKEDGWLPHRFANYAEKDAFENRLLQEVQNANTPALKAEAEAKLDKFRLKWRGAQNVEQHPKFGTLQGNVVTRNVWDTLGTFDSITNPSSSLLRSIAGAHTAIKLARTAFNPITVVRNMLTMPMFKLIARAEWQDMMEGWRIMKDANHPLRAEIMKNGIGNVDQVKTEFFKEFENVTGGKYNFGNLDLTKLGLGSFDLDVAGKYANRGIRNWLDVYRLPDNMVRIGSYLSAKRRLAQELGKTLDDPEVIQKAVSFTNRYTMNYDTVAPIVKAGRQMPFVNMFISYTAEMTRILKNLGQDLVSGDTAGGVNHSRMHAAIPLAMLAVVPELLQNSAESGLSPEDQRDWEKAKKLMPSYARTRYRIFLSRDADGQFHYTDITPLIASDALNQSVKAIVQGDPAALGSVNPLVGLENTPALNLMTAQITGKDLHTQREFRNTSDRIASVAKEVLPPWFPGIGSEAQRAAQAYSENQSGELGVTNQKTGQRLTPADFWQPYWSGVKTGSANLSVLQQRAVSEAKRNIANEVAYLNDVLKSDVKDEVKQRALDKTKVAIAEIQENLRQLVQTEPDRIP